MIIQQYKATQYYY